MGLRRWAKRIGQLAILALTVGFLGWYLVRAAEEWRTQSLSVNWAWLAVGALSYIAGLAVLGGPWWIVMRDRGADIALGPTTRVYLISHIGKYVPGKAMVFVIRGGLLMPFGVSIGIVTLTTFYETFATMASGSIVAVVCLTALPLPPAYTDWFASQRWILWSAIALSAGFVASTLPIGFQLFTRIVTAPFQKASEYARTRVRMGTFFWSMLLGFVSWSIVGASYQATINAVAPEKLGWEAWPMATACVALSIVVGFVSMLPGQAGVRDLILIGSLAPVLGELVAVAAAVLFRLLTLVTEAVAAGLLYFGRWRHPPCKRGIEGGGA